jgi:hypothetical protein
MSGGKGGSTQQTSSTAGTSQTQIPPWLTAAGQQAVGTAQDLSQRPYTPYTGQQVADPTAATQQAYQEVQNQQGSANPAFAASAGAYQGLLPSVAPITAAGVNQNTSQLYGGYQQNVMQPTQGLLGNYLGNASPATAQQVGQNATSLMSPYSQAVIQPALQLGQQQLAQNLQQIGGQANNVGAFGGSRQGVAEGVANAQEALGAAQLGGNLLQQGWNTALSPATSLAQQASQQGYGAASLLGQMGQTGYDQAAQQGQNLAGTNLQAGLTAAGQYPTQAVQQAQLAQQQAGALQATGTAQQQQQQAELNAQQGNFYAQQNWPVQNLDLLLGSMGVPYGTSTATTGTGTAQQTTTPGLMNQITGGVGLLGSAAGIGNSLFGTGGLFA